MTYSKLANVLACGVCIVTMAMPAQAQTRTFNIAAGGLKSALDAYSRQSGRPIIYQADQVRGVRTRGAIGRMSAEAALDAILSGTPFRPQADRSGAIAIVRAGNGTADADQASSSGVADPDASTEIVVTAQKKRESVQDVPVPVSVISPQKLIENNLLTLRDYYNSIPGLNVSPNLQSTSLLSIRGITTGAGTNPTVGVMVDELPYGASTSLGGGGTVPDIDPGDLARIEVLRGPQGTLYGAGSMGGLLKFVTRDPNMREQSGRVSAGISSVSGGELGYNVRGAVNLPLSSTFAVAASGFHRRDPGYIDNAATGEQDVNQAKAQGGRLAALWTPSSRFSARFQALVQTIRADGSSDADRLPGLGTLEQSRLIDSGWYDRTAQVYSLTLNADVGASEVTSVSGYSINSYKDSFDYTWAIGSAIALPLFGVSGAELLNDNRTRKVTQEIRVRVPIGSKIEWLVGGFYTDEDSKLSQNVFAIDPDDGDEVALISGAKNPTSYSEVAGFTNLTFNLTKSFSLQLGARQAHIKTANGARSLSGPVALQGAALPPLSSKADAFTFLVTPQFRLSDDLMLYARIASGYRAGGPNAAGGVAGTPLQFDPDSTVNYEIGAKGSVLDHKLQFDLSVYQIDWSDIQINLRNATTGLTYKTNGSEARSRGFEIAAQLRPVRGLSLGGWIAFNDAELTEDLPANPAAFGRSGDRLPNSARWSSNGSIDYNFDLSSNFSANLGASVSYVGNRLNVFRAVSLRERFPAYSQINLRAGVTSGDWSANLFASNVTNKRGILQGGLGYFPVYSYAYIQPRTIGLSIAKNF